MSREGKTDMDYNTDNGVLNIRRSIDSASSNRDKD